ncbi:acyl-[acyl-carrier-protein] thioesterase [Roseospira goensis]|uniref:Acyl-ACP thioesterase n=1 Tax=Roseospira goensis TaxID=391922 RepID=A0A7W6RZ91_9PROT|nr:acyl-ACP thioesterase domain-containing protein [Roseospira goensis]MBB4285981.1 acyl-ACP thioesterase [Roseospira goensis]
MADSLQPPVWTTITDAAAPALASRLRFPVRVREATPDGRIGLPALADLCQEAAAANADRFGEGLADTMARGGVWVLNRARYALRRYPRLGETVSVETWPGAVERRGAVRHYRLAVEGGGVVGAAVSVWSLFDLATRRPLAHPDAVLRALPAPGPALLPAPAVPAPLPADAVAATARYPVHPAQVDVYGHVNHTHLVAWALGEAGAVTAAPFQPDELIIAFRGECPPHGVIEARRDAGTGGRVRSSLVTAAEGRDIVRAAALYGHPGGDTAAPIA